MFFLNWAPINLIDEFINWFVKNDGIKHNYFTDSFSKDKQKLKIELINYENIYKSEFGGDVFILEMEEINNHIHLININLDKKEGLFFDFSAKKSNHMPRAILGKNNYLKFLNEKAQMNLFSYQIEFNISEFQQVAPRKI